MTATSAAPRVLRNFLNGEYVEAQTDATTDLVSPVTAQVVAKAPVSTAADVDAAYSSASSSVVSGVVSDGLRTIVLPAARAGPIFQTAIIIG